MGITLNVAKKQSYWHATLDGKSPSAGARSAPRLLPCKNVKIVPERRQAYAGHHALPCFTLIKLFSDILRRYASAPRRSLSCKSAAGSWLV